MLIDIIVAESSDFLRVSSLIEVICAEQKENIPISYRLIYTGSYTDNNANTGPYKQINIPVPDICLEVSSSTEVEQIAIIMVRYEKILISTKPDIIIVTGDSNATAACAITGKKNHNIPIGHIEAGIRSYDMAKPREINRIVTDSLTDLFFTTSHTANENLRKLNIEEERIFFIGNTRIDTLLKQIKNLPQPELWHRLKLKAQNYILVNLNEQQHHEPSFLQNILQIISQNTADTTIVFTTLKGSDNVSPIMDTSNEKLLVTETPDYLHFIYLLQHAKALITDYSGLQEEATMMNIPCMRHWETTWK